MSAPFIFKSGCEVPYLLPFKAYKLCWTWYWTSMLWYIDSCQNRVPTDRCHMTVSLAQVYNPMRWHVFFKVLCWPVKVFKIAGSENFTLESHFSKVPTRALLSALLHSFVLFLGSGDESHSQVFTVYLLESGDSTFKQRCSCKSHAVDKHCICSKCYSCWVMYSNWEKNVLCFLSQFGILPHTLNPPAS